jgi:hypothetical protein
MKRPSPLTSALSNALLPAPEDRLLLRACLKPGESGQKACEAWLKQHTESQHGVRKDSVKAFLPLLLRAAQIHGIEVDTAFRTVLRTAALREKLRTNAYHDICRDLFSTLAANEIPTIVLGGVALAETVYADRAARHSHDIDIVIPGEEMSRAARLLPSLGFKAITLPQSEMYHWKFEHESGVPLQLHSRLFHSPHYNIPWAEVWARSRSSIVAGVAMNILPPADNLFQVCGHASYSRSRRSLRWVSDAWFIIDQHRDLDWDQLLEAARRNHLALPLSVMLGYLAEDLDAPIPAAFLNRLDAAALQTDATGREAVLCGALESLGGSLDHVLRATDDWRTRVFFIKWMLFPSVLYLRSAEQVRHSWLLPWYYVYRPLRYIARRLRWHFKSRTQSKAPQADPVIT